MLNDGVLMVLAVIGGIVVTGAAVILGFVGFTWAVYAIQDWFCGTPEGWE